MSSAGYVGEYPPCDDGGNLRMEEKYDYLFIFSFFS